MAASELKKIRVGTRIDAEALVCYCLAVKMVEDAQSDIDKNGLTVQTERGWTKNPACTILNSAMQQVRQFANEFGFTPVARARVSAAPPEDEESPWEALKKQNA
jgi:P27 family predicted phage terminase small subunit